MMPAGENENGSNGAVATDEAGAQKENPPHVDRQCSVLTGGIYTALLHLGWRKIWIHLGLGCSGEGTMFRSLPGSAL